MQFLQELSTDTIRENAPAVFSTRPAPDRTERYHMVHSAAIIDAMAERDFVVTSAGQDRPTRRDPAYVRHMLRFAHRESLGKAAVVNDVVPQMLFWNSHNGRTKARLTTGFFRFVCANGMVVGEDVSTYAFSHVGDVEEQLKRGLQIAAETTEQGKEKIDWWKTITMSRPKIVRFGEEAAKLRFGETAGSYNVEDIIRPRRDEDQDNVLWTVFNRVQENLMVGGLEGRNANGRTVHSRAVTGITNDLHFNRGLWQLADEVAQAA